MSDKADDVFRLLDERAALLARVAELKAERDEMPMEAKSSSRWTAFAARIESWLASNQKELGEVCWGKFPMGMVGRWIERAEQAEGLARSQAEQIAALREALSLVDSPYPLDVFPERTDEQRDAIYAAMRAVDKYATEWFYAHVARDRGRVARETLALAEDAAAGEGTL